MAMLNYQLVKPHHTSPKVRSFWCMFLWQFATGLWQTQSLDVFFPIPGLVKLQTTMENHHVQWENPLFLWSFSIAMLVITRGYKQCKQRTSYMNITLHHDMKITCVTSCVCHEDYAQRRHEPITSTQSKLPEFLPRIHSSLGVEVWILLRWKCARSNLSGAIWVLLSK